MYPNPMQQQQQQLSPMQRPPTMMNTTSIPLPNTAAGVPSMRPMVAPSPMQASMIPQQSPQSSMMTRPVGNPYGVINRPTFYDKNKRSTYSNDLRQQQQIIQPGQQPQMTYGNVMTPNQTMMSNTIAPSGAGPIRQQ
jgi:hypothetical protein